MVKLPIWFAIAFAPFVTSYYLDDKNFSNDELVNVNLESAKVHGNNFTVSLDQFTVLKSLATNGGANYIFVVKKNGGSDDGTFYAMKAMKIRESYQVLKKYYDFFKGERRTLEAVRGSQGKANPWATALHYAFRDGKYLFLVMDLATGGSLQARIHETNPPDLAKIELILAELVVAVEKLHSEFNILHGDLNCGNFLIDSHGHLLVTDFGSSKPLADKATDDWANLRNLFFTIFVKTFRDETRLNLVAKLKNLTDAQIPELKKHPFFEGIDWAMVAERKSEPPFAPNEIQINEGTPIDIRVMLQLDVNNELDADIAEELQDYPFVAPEHRN